MHVAIKNNFRPKPLPRTNDGYQNMRSEPILFPNGNEDQPRLFHSASPTNRSFLEIPSEVINLIGSFLYNTEILKTLLPVSKQILDIIVNDPHFEFEIRQNDRTIAKLDYRSFKSNLFMNLKREIERDANGLAHALSPVLYGLATAMRLEFPYFSGASLVGLLGPVLNFIDKRSYVLFLKHLLYQESMILGIFSLLILFMFAYAYSNSKKIESPRFPLSSQDSNFFSLETEIAGRRHLFNRNKNLEQQEKIHQEFLDMFRRIKLEISK